MDSFVIGSYIVCGILFIFSLAGLRHQKTSKGGVMYGVFAMTLAIIAGFFEDDFDYNFSSFFAAFLVGGSIGTIAALKVEMIEMPQMVAALHSFVGIAATMVAFSHFLLNTDQSALAIIETNIGVFIGAVTFTGSVVAYGKLNGNIRGEPLILLGWGRHLINLVSILLCVGLSFWYAFIDDVFIRSMLLLSNSGVAGFIGWHLVMAIGGADMPVVVSMLNSYSGWATCASGFLLENELLIITGALVGSSGAILSYIMCEAMNRSFFSVIAGGFGQGVSGPASAEAPQGECKEISKEQLVKSLQDAKRIVIVPGYGMAAAKCQHNIATLCTLLQSKGKKVQFCIHPVAGRLPGHMNVLLAEADVDYNLVKEMEELNPEFSKIDVVLIIGANDIVNPDALENPNSPIAGMPVCKVWESKKVVVFKRGKGTGYAGIENPLFYKPVTSMFYGDAAKSVQVLLNSITELGDSFGGTAVVESEEEEEIQQDLDFPEPVLTVGVLKETFQGEKRVAVTPKTVSQFRKLGFSVRVEESAGLEATFTDEQYSSQGASVLRQSEVWNSDIILKIRKPELEELSSISENVKCLICYVHPSSNKQWLESVASQYANLSVMSMDCVPRITKAQKLDSLSSMANIGGYRAVIEAFQYFSKCPKPMITAAGKLPPAQVLIMGVGVAGLSAIGYCKSLGCIVKAIDTRAAAKNDAESMGAKFLQVSVKEDGSTAGGYAREMSEEYKRAQFELIMNTAKAVDIIITTALIPGRPAPVLLPEEVVRNMKPGSVIVDMAAEMGGNCALTKKNEAYLTENGVWVVGFTDLVSRMAPQSSELYANNLFHLLDDMGQAKGFKVDLNEDIVKAMCVVKQGQVTWDPNRAPVAVSAKVEEQKITGQVIHPKDESIIARYDYLIISILLVSFSIGVSFATFEKFMNLVLTFVLSLFVGYMVIWNVTPALHTPLMSVTNAISGIIIVGAMMCLEPDSGLVDVGSGLGIASVFFASINIWGGFIVTYRMLNMFKTNISEKRSIISGKINV